MMMKEIQYLWFIILFILSSHIELNCAKSATRTSAHLSTTEPSTTVATTTTEGPCLCKNATYSASDKSETFTSPNYPENYCNSASCKWTIKKSTTPIKLEISEFDSELTFDSLTVYYYLKDDTTIKLFSVSGHNISIPTSTFPAGTALDLIFTSDASVSGTGFSGKISQLSGTQSCACPSVVYDATDIEQELKSPNYPNSYCVSMRCYYLIRTQSGYGIQLIFDDLQTEGGYDYVSIYDGDSVGDNRLLGTVSGKLKSSASKFTSKLQDMLMVFNSDDDSVKKGFEAKYKRVISKCSCPQSTYSGSSGTITSPGYGSTSCDNTTCDYRIQVPSGKFVQLNFPSISMNNADQLSIPTTSGYDLPLMLWQGDVIGSVRFTSDSNQLDLRFKSDVILLDNPRTPIIYNQVSQVNQLNIKQHPGFNANYSAVSRSADCSCKTNPQEYSASEGSIDRTACGPLDCFYILNPPASDTARISIWLDSVNIDSENDFVTVSGGRFNPDKLSPTFIASFVGNSTNNKKVTTTTTGNVPVMVYFHSQNGYTGSNNGFKLRYSWETANCSCTQQQEIAVTKSGGSLSSPGYPLAYCNSMNCTWVLRVSSGKIKLTINDLNTELNVDYLKFYDGTDASLTNEQIGNVSGNLMNSEHVTRQFKSKTSVVTVVFTSDTSVTGQGWNITYGIA